MGFVGEKGDGKILEDFDILTLHSTHKKFGESSKK
jgi:hypothetical protein